MKRAVELQVTDILDLLKHPQGATVDELMQATGWQRHSMYDRVRMCTPERRSDLTII